MIERYILNKTIASNTPHFEVKWKYENIKIKILWRQVKNQKKIKYIIISKNKYLFILWTFCVLAQYLLKVCKFKFNLHCGNPFTLIFYSDGKVRDWQHSYFTSLRLPFQLIVCTRTSTVWECLLRTTFKLGVIKLDKRLNPVFRWRLYSREKQSWTKCQGWRFNQWPLMYQWRKGQNEEAQIKKKLLNV